MHVEENHYMTHVHNYSDTLQHPHGIDPLPEGQSTFYQFAWTLLPWLGVSELEKGTVSVSANLENIGN